jgi:hypothetical protein
MDSDEGIFKGYAATSQTVTDTNLRNASLAMARKAGSN